MNNKSFVNNRYITIDKRCSSWEELEDLISILEIGMSKVPKECRSGARVRLEATHDSTVVCSILYNLKDTNEDT